MAVKRLGKLKRSGKRVITKPTSKKDGVKPKLKSKTSMTSKFKESGVSSFSTGAAGFKRAKQEKKSVDANKRKRSIPFTLWLKPGTEADVIIVDKEPYFMYEHQYKTTTGHWDTERCIKETGHCPACSKLNREGHYVMKLTCIDLRSYTDKEGRKVKASKKIMVVKLGQMPKFERMYERNGNSFRGLKLHLTRDGDKDSAIGNDIELVATLKESVLAKYGEDLLTPVKYVEAFPILTEAEMAKQFGTSGALGSKDFNDDDDDNVDEDENDWG